jgi:hypothetical protein
MAFCRQTTGEKGGVFGQKNDCTRVCLVYGPSRLAVQAKKFGHAKETWPSFGWMPKFGGQPSHILID